MEWVALVALVAMALGALLWATGLAGTALALPSAVAERIVCAARLSAECRSDPKLAEAYGADVSRLLGAHAPTVLYEDGMTALPVDYRRCRSDACAAGAGEGRVSRSDAGEPVTAFTHAIDCRADRAAATEAAGANCSGDRAGNLYLQFWFYYPGSATGEGSTPLKRPIRSVSTALGSPSYHPDDWESLQIRIEPDGRRFARASSHRGYSYQVAASTLVPGFRLRTAPGGPLLVERRAPVVNGWGPDMGTLYVAGGSHAGNARVDRDVGRETRAHRLRLVPLRAIAQHDGTAFAVTPPWRKRVFTDPEYAGTD